MHAVRNFTGKGYLVVCTCPEALAERVADAEALQRETITVRVGDRISIEVLEQALVDASFTCVDFVYEPGQYSVRGGIVDVFSYSESKPYRLDFFGDEVDSIRRFNISSQLSSDRLERVEIIPDLNAGTPAAAKVSFARFAGAEASWWFYDADFVLRRVNDIRRRTLSDMEHPDEIDSLLTSRNSLVADLSGSRIFLLRDNLPERPAAATVKFATSPQPKFNKNFEMLADDMIRGALRGYDTYILSENKAQVERLENIFHQIGRGQAVVRSLSTTLHEGFVDNDLKLCLYTDHQIFDRYQRYRINGEIRRDEQMTVAELNQLRPGDYVVHIDHGVGRFDGLVKIAAGDGRMQEAIKLVYKDGDVLFVNVHSLHRISRYKSGDGEPPKVYKLGNGAWQKLKNATKKAVKDISRELIALYAKRKASKGYAFSHDSYLQHELEASFRWEDTPDQQSATAAIKKDMESDQPMDRLGRRGLRQDRGGDPRGVQGRCRRQAGRRAGSDDDPRLAALPLVHRASARFPGEGGVHQPHQIHEGGQPDPRGSRLGEDRHPDRHAQDAGQADRVPRPGAADHRRGAEIRRRRQGKAHRDERFG